MKYLSFCEPGKKPKVSKGTSISLDLEPKAGTDAGSSEESGMDRRPAWSLAIVGAEGNRTNVTVTPTAECCVGIWELTINTTKKSDPKKIRSHKCKNKIYILFNPWCKGKNIQRLQSIPHKIPVKAQSVHPLRQQSLD